MYIYKYRQIQIQSNTNTKNRYSQIQIQSNTNTVKYKFIQIQIQIDTDNYKNKEVMDGGKEESRNISQSQQISSKYRQISSGFYHCKKSGHQEMNQLHSILLCVLE